MIRLFMMAMLLSGSLATDLYSSCWWSGSSSSSSSSSSECERGPTGPRGARGLAGATGITGATGATGLNTPNIIMPFTSASSQIMSSITPPFLGSVHIMPFGGSPAGRPLSSNGMSGPQLVLLPIQHYAYNLPIDIVVVSIAATTTLFDFIDEPTPGTEITFRVEIWVAPPHGNTFTPSGAGVSFPTLVVPANPSDLNQTTQTVGPTPLSVAIPAGSRILMVDSFTCEENIRLRSVSTAGISLIQDTP